MDLALVVEEEVGTKEAMLVATKADGNGGLGADTGDGGGTLGIGELGNGEGSNKGTGDGGMCMGDGEGDGAGNGDAGDGSFNREGASVCEGTRANPGNGARQYPDDGCKSIDRTRASI